MPTNIETPLPRVPTSGRPSKQKGVSVSLPCDRGGGSDKDRYRKRHSDELIAFVRKIGDDGLSHREIQELTGMPLSSIRYHLAQHAAMEEGGSVPWYWRGEGSRP